MLELAIANLKANKGRFVATVIAIVVGVMFLSAGLIFTDAIKSGLGGSLAERYAHVDASLAGTEERGQAAKVPDSLAETVAKVDGVKSVAGELEGPVGLFVTGRKKAEGVTGRLWIDNAALNPIGVASGRAPAASGEVAVDRRTAADHRISVGDRVKLTVQSGAGEFTVVGLTRFGDDDSQDNDGTISFDRADAFAAINGGPVEYSRILVQADAGVTQTALIGRLAKVAPAGVDANDRAAFLDNEQGELANIATFLKPVFTGFSLLALFVCGFVVTNTFAVVIAQRTRELALLRAIGATPRQVKRSVRIEAMVVGFFASLVGIAAGFGLVVGAVAILNANNVRLAGAGAKLSVGTIVFCSVMGTIVTVLAVFGASRRASRIAPVEAMRSGVIDSPTGIKGLVNRLVFLIIGIVVLIIGSVTANGYVLGIGALVFIVSVLRGGRVLVVGAARLMMPLLRRVGTKGRLADDNIQRNPKRAASTANALVIGVLLITLVTTAGGSLRNSIVSRFDNLSSADLQVTGQTAGIPPALTAKIAKVDGVTVVAPVTLNGAVVAPVAADGSVGDPRVNYASTGTPAQLRRVASIKMLAGSLDDLTDDGIAVIRAPAGGGFGGGGNRGLPAYKLGDRVQVAAPGGQKKVLTVQAIIEANLDTAFFNNLVTGPTFDQLFGKHPASLLFIKIDGRTPEQVKTSIEGLTDNYPSIRVIAGNLVSQTVGTVLDFLINGINGLLAMSVLIAVIGVFNTMTLAIIERRRELGLLRAVGMMPNEARTMVGIEAVLIATIGTLIGLVSGAFLAFWLTQALGTDKFSVTFSFEWPKLLLILAIGIIVGVLSSLLPARRVGKMNVLAALQE